MARLPARPSFEHHVQAGFAEGPTTEQQANRFLDLVCLHYGPDSSRGAHKFDDAAALLEAHPEIARHSLHTAAVAGEADTLREMVAQDPGAVDQKGGPFQ